MKLTKPKRRVLVRRTQHPYQNCMESWPKTAGGELPADPLAIYYDSSIDRLASKMVEMISNSYTGAAALHFAKRGFERGRKRTQ